MIGLSQKCNIPTSFLEIRPVIPEKIFEGFSQCICMAAILVQNAANKLSFSLPIEALHDLVLIDHAVSENMMF